MTIQAVKLVLTNPKSPTNVGAVMRAAGCYRAEEIYYTGQRYERAAKYNTDTKNASLHIPLTSVTSALDIPLEDSELVCVELVEGATPLPDFIHPTKAIYVFGAEDGTIEQSVIDSADHVVYIPTVGCMNLAATVNVVLYDRLAKSKNYPHGDQLIKDSRDTNNKVKVK
ncbi:RNA methyltransferase [Thalassotalea profundi]|uniref:23S rRNA methyltransferase n=1 Tax=Thalassotalea profundi TaxID=2036687 RepID=A0ABQ3INI2_9GAMM|nr:RNA methyltransferase [Thalassotalea profundi]GHE86849.1 23S rRNA methyltransferase [Thalassotalea profundi]